MFHDLSPMIKNQTAMRLKLDILESEYVSITFEFVFNTVFEEFILFICRNVIKKTLEK